MTASIKTFIARILLVIVTGMRALFAQGDQPVKWDDAAKQRVADEVTQEFLHAWRGYKKYAWGHDELRPLSKTFHDWHDESLLMTPVDALDTMILMGLTVEADITKSFVLDNLSFEKDFFVSNFEITIRLLGGLLSGYQLTGDHGFLVLAEDLGARLLPIFDSPTGIPYRFVNLKTGAVRGPETNPAEAGTLLLEFGTLSKLTRNPVFHDKARRAQTEVYRRRSSIGLVGQRINVETGAWTHRSSHLSAEIDSYYEYLLKGWLLFGDQECRQMWLDSFASIRTYLADEEDSQLWYGEANMDTGQRTATRFGALDAFFPAVLVLAGNIGDASRLQASCIRMWTLHGVEPERVNYKIMVVEDPSYPLRPEIIESTYYLYRATGDDEYLEMGKRILDALVRHCKTETGYASLTNVITKEKGDEMQSFLLAETFKYLYLLFAPPSVLPFEEVVFNTEAHPIRKTWK
jgi:hypothetical protein